MSPQETVQILQNLVSSLESQRAVLVNNGDLERVSQIDANIESTNATISIIQQAIS
jgi:ribosomal protein L6P/L9E